MAWGFRFLQSGNITGTMLKNVVPTMTEERSDLVADLLNKFCPYYKMDNHDVLHEFIAQVAHESGGFRLREENMNYSWQRLRVIFQRYFKTDATAKQFHRQPEKIANFVYGKRMGNVNPGDGWFFRGGGFIQVTGRDIYTRYAKYKNELIDAIPNLIRTSDQWALDSACWVFAVEKDLIQMAIDDKFEIITRRINGGVIGWKDRVYFYERAKKYII